MEPIFIFVILSVVLSVVVATYAQKKGFRWGEIFLIGLVFSPIISMAIVLVRSLAFSEK